MSLPAERALLGLNLTRMHKTFDMLTSSRMPDSSLCVIAWLTVAASAFSLLQSRSRAHTASYSAGSEA
jgi:hypothetical protein